MKSNRTIKGKFEATVAKNRKHSAKNVDRKKLVKFDEKFR